MGNHRYDLDHIYSEGQSSAPGLLYISKAKYEGDWNSIPHSHPFVELFYVITGQGSFLMEHESYPVTEHDLIIIAPHREHTEKSTGSLPLEYMVLGIEGISFLDGEAASFRHNYGKKSDIQQILNRILLESQEKQPGYETLCQSLLSILLVLVTRKQKLTPVHQESEKMTKECGQVKQYLDFHYAQTITLDQLATMTHMSKFYLAHAFTKYTGLSPIRYLTARRLQAGKELLTSTDYSVAEIAVSVGFSSQSYFSQVFKKEVGMTPGEYRRGV